MNSLINYSCLLTIILLSTAQNVLNKHFTLRQTTGRYFFTAFKLLFSVIPFLIMNRGIHPMPAAVWPYVLGMAVAFSSASIFTFLAICEGSLAKTSLFVSYSLLIPVLYGLLFNGEPFTVLIGIGLFLLALSIFLTRGADRSQKKVTAKWLIFALLGALGNGFCSTVQKMQGVAFDGNYTSDFMIRMEIICSALFLALLVFTEPHEIKPSFKNGFWAPALAGLANGIVNFLVILLNGRGMAASVMFPVISAGGIVCIFFVSLFLYKEKFSVRQYIGFAAGILSIVLLNL